MLNSLDQPNTELLSCKMGTPAFFHQGDLVDLTPFQLSFKGCVGSKPLPPTIFLSSGYLFASSRMQLKFTAANGAWFTVTGGAGRHRSI
jgi:hypothetical protein